MSERAKSRIADLLINSIPVLLAIGLIVWKGGALVSVVEAHEVRISAIEQTGSTVVKSHILADDQMKQEIDRRITRLENAVLELPEMRSDIKWIRQNLK